MRDTVHRATLSSDVKLAVRNLTMVYGNGHTALQDMNLSVEAGEMVVVLGSNGCGKSTFMKCVVGLNRPTTGTVEVAGRDLTGLSGSALREARLPLALISQHANLVRRRSVLANVCSGSLARHRTLATALGRVPRSEMEPALGYLAEVGLAGLATQRAGTLSGGQANALPLHGRWPSCRRSCSPTNPLRVSTPKPPTRSCGSCAAWPPKRALPWSSCCIRLNSQRVTPTGSSACAAGG